MKSWESCKQSSFHCAVCVLQSSLEKYLFESVYLHFSVLCKFRWFKTNFVIKYQTVVTTIKYVNHFIMIMLSVIMFLYDQIIYIDDIHRWYLAYPTIKYFIYGDFILKEHMITHCILGNSFTSSVNSVTNSHTLVWLMHLSILGLCWELWQIAKNV